VDSEVISKLNMPNIPTLSLAWFLLHNVEGREKDDQGRKGFAGTFSNGERCSFRCGTARASTSPHQLSTRLRQGNAQFNRCSLTYLAANTEIGADQAGPLFHIQ